MTEPKPDEEITPPLEDEEAEEEANVVPEEETQPADDAEPTEEPNA